jgi:hypothetical protein
VASVAAEQSLPGAITSAFQTVVIDAGTAAAQATAAAKDALAPGGQKTSTPTKKKKDPEPSKAGEPAKPAPSKDTAHKDEAAPSNKGATQAGDVKADPKAKADQSKDTKDAKAAEPTEWPTVDIELAKARCAQILKGVAAVTVAEAPFRKGECGAPAPVRLISIGKSPEVSFSPPAVMTCDMVANLAKWIEGDVQPLARRHLGSEVISVESMSDYSCRHAYGRIANKLSEHGKANALDIRGFVTRKGQSAYVLESWGKTKRDVEKEVAAAKGAGEAVRTAAKNADKMRAELAAAAEAPAADGSLPRKTIVEGLPAEPAKKKGSSLALPASVTKEGLTHLGGPNEAAKGDGKGKRKSGKDGQEAATEVAALPPAGAGGDPEIKAPPPKDATGRFLHEAHDAACRIFGTTLGPEANEAHRNHFHVDMAERKIKKICD